MAEAQQAATFEEFYKACFDRLVGQLALVTGSLPEAEDVVQEAFLRAAAHWPRLRHYDVPEQWVRRVALRLAINQFRRARRRGAALVRLGPPPVTPPASADALVLDGALRTLPIRHRQVVVLHYLLGLSVEEIGRELVRPVGTLKSQLHRARQALARQLAERGGEPPPCVISPNVSRSWPAPMHSWRRRPPRASCGGTNDAGASRRRRG